MAEQTSFVSYTTIDDWREGEESDEEVDATATSKPDKTLSGQPKKVDPARLATPTPPAAPATDKSDARAQTNVGSKEGVVAAVEEKKPDLPSPSFEDFDKMEDIDKYKRYEADYTYRLMAKYFSEKNACGGNIFDEQVTINGEIIKASRWPSTSSYVDPLSVFKDLGCCGVTVYGAEEAANTSNGKQPPKK